MTQTELVAEINKLPLADWEKVKETVNNLRTNGTAKPRNSPAAKLELYDLATDLVEAHDIAADRPEITNVIETYLRTARTDSPDWPIREPEKKKPADPAPAN